MVPRACVLVLVLSLSLACQPPASTPGCNRSIEWLNFIQVGATQYVAGPGAEPALRESELGPVVAHVKFKVSGSVCDAAYRPKDGDAAFLDPGTPIYQVAGRPAGEELAARFNGRLLVYRPLKPES